MATSSLLCLVTVFLVVIRPGATFPRPTGSIDGFREALLEGDANHIANVLKSSADVNDIVAAINESLPDRPQQSFGSLDFDKTKISFLQLNFLGAVAKASLETGDFNKLAEILVQSGFSTLNGEEVKGALADIRLMEEFQDSAVDKQGRRILLVCSGCTTPSACDYCAYDSCTGWWCTSPPSSQG